MSVRSIGLLTAIVLLAVSGDAQQRPAEAPLQILNPHYATVSESIVVDEGVGTGREHRFKRSIWLTLKSPIKLLCVESHDDRTVNDNDGSGHVSKLLEIGKGTGILRYVALVKLDAFLRKILFRLVAEHSPLLRINHDVLRHSSPPAWVLPVSSNRWMDSFAPLIASRTGLSE
jgi:hypothetical protein